MLKIKCRPSSPTSMPTAVRDPAVASPDHIITPSSKPSISVAYTQEGSYLPSAEFGVHLIVLCFLDVGKSVLWTLSSLLFCHQPGAPIYF